MSHYALTRSRALCLAMTETNPMDNILAAARRCYINKGIAATGMKEVAAATGIARSTLYRYFPGRDELLIATVKEEMLTLNGFIRERLDVKLEPAHQVVEGLLLAIREIPHRPLLATVFASEEGSRARQVIWQSALIVQFGEELMDHVVGPASVAGLLQDTAPPEVLVEWVYRLLLSFLTLPSNVIGSEEELRATLHALLVPILLK